MRGPWPPGSSCIPLRPAGVSEGLVRADAVPADLPTLVSDLAGRSLRRRSVRFCAGFGERIGRRRRSESPGVRERSPRGCSPADHGPGAVHHAPERAARRPDRSGVVLHGPRSKVPERLRNRDGGRDCVRDRYRIRGPPGGPRPPVILRSAATKDPSRPRGTVGSDADPDPHPGRGSIGRGG